MQRPLSALMITLAAGLFAVGLTAPLFTFQSFFVFKDTMSLIGVVETLYDEDKLVLSAVVALFSIVFPSLKLAALSVLAALGDRSAEAQARVLHFVETLGKWSMADVFILAVTVVAVKASGMATVFDHPAIYVFGGSVVLAMLAGMILTGAVKSTAARAHAAGVAAPNA